MNKEINNNLSWLIVGLTVLIALAVLFYANNNFYQEFIINSKLLSSYTIPKNAKVKHALIELDFGNGKKRAFRGEVDDTIYDLKSSLEIIAKEAKFTFREKNGRIEKLADIGNASGVWKIYQNGQVVNQSLQELTVTGGDKYVLRFEK